MHGVAETLAILYVKTRRYTVRPYGFYGINIIYYISDCLLLDVKICKR